MERAIPAMADIITAMIMVTVSFSPRNRTERITVTTGNNEDSGVTRDTIPEENAIVWVRKAVLPKIPTMRQTIRSLFDMCQEKDCVKIRTTVKTSIVPKTMIVTRSDET